MRSAQNRGSSAPSLLLPSLGVVGLHLFTWGVSGASLPLSGQLILRASGFLSFMQWPTERNTPDPTHTRTKIQPPPHCVCSVYLGKNECWSPSFKLILAPTNGWASILKNTVLVPRSFLGGSDSKGSACNAGDPGSITGSGRSPGEGNGNPLQYFCLESSMDRGTWRDTVHGVKKSQTRLRD